MSEVGALGARNPAWDGLRGIAVVAVLLYHVEGHPLPGGFLGVSLFFTLSGFVITRGLLGELDRSGRISLTGFWARRVRRLLPPIALCSVLVLLYGHLAATGNQRAALRWDLFAALTDWMNWRSLGSGATYGGQDLNPSPLLHAWSLSIEEQAYLLLPLLAILGWRLRGRIGVAVALAVPLALSGAAGVLSAGHPQVWYLGSHVRLGEILVGALLAIASTTTWWPRVAAAARYAAVPAIAFMGWAAWHATTDASWLPRGGLMAHATATSILIAACTGGVWRRALGWRPLAALGLISYGVYLYHWPIYLWITPASTGWGRWPTTAVRGAVTLALAVASYLLLERHVVALRPRQRHTLAVGGAGLALALFVASVASPSASANERVTLAEGLVAPDNAALATPTPPTAAPPSVPPSAMPTPTTAVPTTQASAPPLDVSAAVDDASTTTPPTAPPTTAPPATADFAGSGSPWFAARTDGGARLNGPPLVPSPLGRPPVILVVGDSAAGTLGLGLQRVSTLDESAIVYVATRQGCPIGPVADIRWNRDVVFTPADTCSGWRDEAPRIRDGVHPDLVVSLVSIWEITDRRLDADGPWVTVGDPTVDDALRADLGAYAEAFAGADTRIVWLLPPPLRNSIYAKADGPLPEEDPARLAHLDEIIASFAAGRPNTYTYDTAAALGDRYGDPYGLENRIDGFHWSDAGADREAAWLLPMLVAVANGG